MRRITEQVTGRGQYHISQTASLCFTMVLYLLIWGFRIHGVGSHHDRIATPLSIFYFKTTLKGVSLKMESDRQYYWL